MKKFLSLSFCLFVFAQIGFSQLSPGAIAFIGVHTDTPDGFTFINLTPLGAGEEIYFSERGVDTPTSFSSAEGVYKFTAPASGLPCGTIVNIEETAPNVLTISGVTGATYTLAAGAGFSLSPSDQVLAYQSTGLPATPADATYIAAVHNNYNASCYDPITNWNTTGCPSSITSIEPPGLMTGTNCIVISPGGPILKNSRYSGTLTGGSNELLAAINDFSNWTSSNDATFSIAVGTYSSPAVTCEVILPITLVDFNLQLLPKSEVALSWTTSMETENDYFGVERSTDGATWTEIMQVSSKGPSEELVHYEVIDPAPPVGTIYYRLKQTDYNGTYTYSPLRSVVIPSDVTQRISLFPNPATERVTIVTASGKARIYDVTGRDCTALAPQSIPGEGLLQFNLAGFAPGVYWVVSADGIQKLVVAY